MDKRKITAREVLKDIRSGLSDQDLMEKYTLSSQGLQSVFHKLVTAKVITQSELDDRIPITERTVDLGLYICPACGNIQGKEFTICPRCGFTPPGKSKAAQEQKPATGGKQTPQAKAPSRKPVTHAIPKREAGPVFMREDEAPERGRDPFPDLTRTLAYCRILGIVALVSYALTVAGLIFLQSTSSTKELSLIGLSILGIPAVAIAIVVFVTLRALAESIKIFANVAGSLSKKQTQE